MSRIKEHLHLDAMTVTGQTLGDNIARGYITIDTVNNCTLRMVSDPGYILPGGTGDMTDQNIHWGDFFFVIATATVIAMLWFGVRPAFSIVFGVLDGFIGWYVLNLWFASGRVEATSQVLEFSKGLFGPGSPHPRLADRGVRRLLHRDGLRRSRLRGGRPAPHGGPRTPPQRHPKGCSGSPARRSYVPGNRVLH